jgi:hypothetical protein
MKTDVVIEILEREREDVLKQRNDAMKIAAEPFNIRIAAIEDGIQQRKEALRNQKPLDSSLNEYIKKRKSRKCPAIVDFEVYPLEGSVIDRFRYILKEAKRFLHIREVAEMVKQYEPNEDVTLIKNRFGKHVDKFKAAGLLVTFGKGHTLYYGLPDWIEAGSVKPQYIFKQIPGNTTYAMNA